VSALRIGKLRTTIVDLPTFRPHRFADHEIHHQSYLLVDVHTDAGVDGVGEGASPGGPWWSGESIEGQQQQLIEIYLAPVLEGMDCLELPLIRAAMDRVTHGNEFAKAAVEMAVLDATGRALGVPVHRLLGGAARLRLPVRWALSGSGEQEVADEAIERLGQGHPALKLKLGALPPAEDFKRAARLITRIGADCDYLVDPNGSWDYRTAVTSIKELEAMGVSVVEQPVDRRDLVGCARPWRSRPSPLTAVCAATEAPPSRRRLALRPRRTCSPRFRSSRWGVSSSGRCCCRTTSP
jgi:muconate cycloisomerase